MSKIYEESKDSGDLLNNSIDNTLSDIFELGIHRTHFKSTDLDKINVLRAKLNLEPRKEALPHKTYDAEVVDALAKIDFTPLDVDNRYHTHAQKMVLGWFSKALPALNWIQKAPELQQEHNLVLLGDDYHLNEEDS